MTRQQAPEIVVMLQTFWPIEWSHRMSTAMEDRLADELAIMFKDYQLQDVQETLRKLARSVTRPPTYKQILDDLRNSAGGSSHDFVFVPYVYKWVEDKLGREYAWQVNAKVYPDGTVLLPRGVPWDDRLLRRQGIIGKDGKGIYPRTQDLDQSEAQNKKDEDAYEGFQETIENLFENW